MSVLGSQTFQSKPLRAVAKKSTSKPPRLWTNGKPPLVMEEDIEQMETSSEVIKTADSTVHQEPCNSLKSLNGAVVADKPSDSSHNGVADASVDKVTTSVLHVTVENTDSSDLLDSKPEKDNNGVIDNTNSTLLDGPTSTDDEDMLLMLSDSDSLTSQDVNDLALNKIVNDSSNNENTNDSALNKDVNALALNKDVKELANDIDVNELALNEDVNQSALNENVNKSALNKNVDELVLITDEIASSSNKDANELEIETEPDKIKDVKAQADHPLAIGVKVRNSVRDIMSKLVQDASPEVNKILSKPKFEEVMKDSPPKSLKPYLDYKSDAKLVKGNLFEIMSAESEPEDMQCSTNPKTQNKKEKDKAATKDVLMETGDENKLKIENKGDIKKVKSQDDNFTMKNEEMDSKEFTKLDTKVEYKPIINTEMKLKIKEEIKTYLKSESAEVKDIKSDVLNSKCVIEDSSSVSNKKINVIEKSDTKDAKLETVTVACAEKMDIDEENNYNSNIESKSNTLDNIKEKKRSIDPSESEGPAPAKRSRLDIMIGKLGDQIGIAPENVPDTISCESDSEEESRQESDDVSEIKSDDEDVRSDDNTADETASKVTEEDADTRSMQEEVHAEADVEKTDIKVAEKSETKTTGTEADIETTEKKMDSKKENETEPTKEVIDLKITEESSIITLDKTESKASDTESVLSTSVDDIEMISDPVKDDNDVTVIISESPEKHQTEIVQEATTSNEKETDLEKMVRKKVLQLIKSYRDETIADLQRKITTLTEANEKWKNTAKDLHKQVVDLTIVQHRLDKRKAATAALKIITSRTIGCQVDSNRLPPLNGYEVLSAQKSPPKTTILSPNQQYTFTNVQMLPGSTPNMVSMIKRPAPVQVNNMSQLLSATAVSRNSVSSTNTILSSSIRQAVPVNTSMRNLLETSGKNAKAITTSQINNVLSGVSRSVVTPNSTVGNSVKVIDLTADEDTAKKINKPPQGKPHVTMMPVASLPPSMGSPQIVRPIGTASSGLPPGASILLSSGPAGTQFVNPSTLRGIGGNLQVVTVSGNNSSIRAGSLLTVVPSQSTTATYPQTVSITTAAPTSTLTTKTVTLDTSNIMMRTPVQTVHTGPPPTVKSMILNTPKHPAPLPPQPVNKTSMGGVKGLVPPKPDLKISRVSQGIVLSWTITHKLTLYSEIASYQLFAYQEGSSPPNSNLWKKVGDVKALPLPMACTLTQFQEGNKYHFAVRALDVYNRISEFSEPSSIHLFPKSS
ncbi:activating transcription factor 7-interacting protein 1 isoform X2 [Patella vulgata]|uniref:activating transcription factor 7-interacting protein 1 isoform X2 n=1 Tax=Patella vulgata TaxID=6465 RepID=UPI00218039D0|nr:activating transcription factor 7-interacting protein 1 isoform X2 [Patella vulgata]